MCPSWEKRVDWMVVLATAHPFRMLSRQRNQHLSPRSTVVVLSVSPAQPVLSTCSLSAFTWYTQPRGELLFSNFGGCGAVLVVAPQLWFPTCLLPRQGRFLLQSDLTLRWGAPPTLPCRDSTRNLLRRPRYLCPLFSKAAEKRFNSSRKTEVAAF